MQQETAMLVLKGVVLAGMLLVAPLGGFAQHEHEHEEADAGVPVPDHGEKWATDAPLRGGMEQIRSLIAVPQATVAAGIALSPADARQLAEGVRHQVDELIRNCKLEPEADAALHVLIADMLKGAAVLAGGSSSAMGLARIQNAINQYPRYFSHSGWEAGGIAVPAALAAQFQQELAGKTPGGDAVWRTGQCHCRLPGRSAGHRESPVAPEWLASEARRYPRAQSADGCAGRLGAARAWRSSSSGCRLVKRRNRSTGWRSSMARRAIPSVT